MSIVVFSNENCKNCETIKNALMELGHEFTEVSAKEALHPSNPNFMDKYPNWFELGFSDALAIYQIDEEIPIVSFNGTVLTFRESLAKIQSMAPRRRVIAFDTVDVECENGVCALTA